MRMKDDAMGKGQLKAAYNVQAGTENQFIVGTTVHQRPGDTARAIPRCEHVKERIGHLPANFVADAGYGSEENYAHLEREGADAYVKHNEFFRECRNEKWLDDEMVVANWAHDENSDKHTRPEGRTLAFCGESRRVSDLGYESAVRTCECEDCSGCSRRARCSSGDWLPRVTTYESSSWQNAKRGRWRQGLWRKPAPLCFFAASRIV